MSSSITRRMMEWDKTTRRSSRPKRPTWVLEENAPAALFDEETHIDITAGRTMRSGRVHATPLATLTETNECIRESSEDFHDVGPPLDDGSILTPPAEPPADLVVRPRRRAVAEQRTGLPPIDIPAAAVARVRLRHQIHRSLQRKGFKPPDEDVALSDSSTSSSDSDFNT